MATEETVKQAIRRINQSLDQGQSCKCPVCGKVASIYKEQRLHIPVKYPSLNDYIDALNLHRQVGAQMKKKYTDSTAEFAEFVLKKVTRPVTIQFTWIEDNRKRDPDNIFFAKKFVLDGLVNAGCLPQDSQKWILGLSDSIDYADEAGVVISIREEIAHG